MFDRENRDDAKRAQSLLASRGPLPRRPSGSLLSISEDDAAERHRQARARREAAQDRQAAQPDGPAGPVGQRPEDEAASTFASRGIASLIPAWISRREARGERRSRSLGLRPSSENPPAVARAGEMNDGGTANQQDAADQQWKPLVDPMKVIGGIARSKLLIASTSALGLLLGVAVAVTTPKKYEAATELLVDPRDLNLVSRDLTPTGLSNEATLAVVENQVRVLTSGSVLTQVVDRLNLANDPEFNGEGGSRGLGLGSFISGIRSLLSRSDSADGGDRQHTIAVRNLSESLRVERGGKTFVISIGAVTRDREKSALIANTTTDVFLQTYGQIQSNTAGRAAEDLTSRLDQLREGVEAAERKVESFKAENDIIDAQGRLITDDEIVKLNEQLTVARARTLELNAKAPAARSINVDAVLVGALPEELASPTIQELRAQYSSLKSDADRLAVRLGPRHPERMAIEAQLAGARDLINTELRRVVSSAQTELKRAVQLEQELAARLAQLKVRQGDVSSELVTLRELEREANAKRAVYEAFLLRARETGEQSDLNTVNMSIISKAHPPLDANPPSRSTIALTGLLLGFLAGLGIGIVRGAYESLRETANERSARRPLKRPRSADRRESVADRSVESIRGKSEPAVDAYETGAPHAALGQPTDLMTNPPVAPKDREALPQTPPVATMEQPREKSMQDQIHPAHAPFGASQPLPAASYLHGRTADYGHGHPQPYAQSPAPIYQPVHPGALVHPQQPIYPQQQTRPVYAQHQMQPTHPPAYVEAASHHAHPNYPQGPVQMAEPWHQLQTPVQPLHPYSQHSVQMPSTGYPVQPQPVHQPQPAPQHFFAPPVAFAEPYRNDVRQNAPETASQASINEIRSSLREFREAVRDLAETRARRRYF